VFWFFALALRASCCNGNVQFFIEDVLTGFSVRY
jgi:hypothetical protein